MSDDLEIERHKQDFLAIIKWISKNTGSRVQFDSPDQSPHADVENKIIHMPKRIAVKHADSTLGTLIHEAMHIKCTPKWLSELCRDKLDHTIFNALEDARIEAIACDKLLALDFFLRKAVEEVKASIADENQVKLGFRVLCNIACQASKERLFIGTETQSSESQNRSLIRDLQVIYDRIFSVTMGKSFETNVEELYKKIDEFRKVYDFPPPDPNEKKEQKKQQVGVNQSYGVGNATAGKYGGVSTKEPGKRSKALDLEDLSVYMINLNDQAKARLKETLKKTLTTEIDEGNSLNTDNLTDIFTGNVDDLFIDTKSEKKMKTKIYFLLDVSGSMGSAVNLPGMDQIQTGGEPERRITLSVSAFKAIADVIDECKNVYGTDVSHDTYIFADNCKKVDKIGQGINSDLGGGTNLPGALQTVVNHIHKDDPANKRILIILTDGDVGNTDELKEIIAKESQDIRIVFVGITDNPSCDLIRHNIMHSDHGEAKIVEAMEEAL